ncbi:torsin-2A-like isoform X2 [Mya arenaria]|uniref:torsin-2A-like isoform X2 n=1 Tax=Mya arenaria TaxID=6604 RepID=UPI0022E39350|nr:torsin-2A-like isoform X2 [Mya arenaria]
MSEEEMELSGESNLASNLHNFSFDVSWSTNARSISPPLSRRHSTVLSPARFVLPRGQTHSPALNSPLTPGALTMKGWKSLVLRERPLNCSTPTVKVSQKTSDSREHSGQFSPMEVDKENSFDVADSFHTSGSPKLRNRHSDFGVTYNLEKKKTDKPKKSMLIIPEKGQPYREKLNSSQVKRKSSKACFSTLEDSVFDSSNANKSVNTSSNMSGLSGSFLEGRKKTVSLALVLTVLVISLGIGSYLYANIETCAIFDVDVVKLSHKLEDNVFGQHIAVKIVTEMLEQFKHDVMEGGNRRSLVMSFHGWTGTGKNYVSRFIAEAFYNARVTLYLAPLHFSRISKDHDGQKELRSWILGNITQCGVTVLIFDEVDKAEKGHLQAIKDIIVHLREQNIEREENADDAKTVSKRPVTVFLFLSNSKASQINSYLFSQILNDRERDLIRKSEFDDIFERSNGEWFEEIKSAQLIDTFVPFLPLAESHVRQCIIRDFMHKGRDPSLVLVSAVMEELSFFDMGGKNGQISLTGCKRVSDKVDLHLDD